jgi:lipoprotein-releasing system permease protein
LDIEAQLGYTVASLGYPLSLALRYLGSKKRAFVSVGTAFAVLGVTLGVAALAIVMSVTGGFQEQFRDKVLGVNAHVLVLKYSIDFREYREIMKKVAPVPGIVAIAPFVINPMMVTHGERTATGVLLKGVDPELTSRVLVLPKDLTAGLLDGRIVLPVPPASFLDEATAVRILAGLRKFAAKPPDRPIDLQRLDRELDGTHVPSSSDAGADAGHKSLMEAIAESLTHDERRDAGVGGSDAVPPHTDPRAPDAPPRAGALAERGSQAGAPRGDVTPRGGFKSQLPDDALPLPEEVDPDPCKSPEVVAALPGAVIGISLARQLRVDLGDCLQITSPTIGISFGATGSRPPIAKQFRVIGIFEAGFDQYDSKLVYTDLYEAQTFYEQGDSVTGIEMKVDDIEHSRAIARKIDLLLGNGIYHTMDWKELNHGLFTALFIQQLGMSFVLGLIVVVAAFTVVATLIMVVLDKKREIAVLKAIGAKDTAILRVFLYQGGIIGLLGTSLGLLVGFVCCKGLLAYGFPLDPKVYFISRLPVNLRPTEFIITGALSIAICLVATVFPALYAARLRPADGLRAE